MSVNLHYIQALVESMLAHEPRWQLHVRYGHEGLTGLPGDVRTERTPAIGDIVALDMGYGLPRPPQVESTDEAGLFVGLSFGGVPHDVFIPWGAVATIVADGHVCLILERTTRPAQERPKLRLLD